MKLEIGMYVRTKCGEIAKIIDIRTPINAQILLFDINLKEIIFNEVGLNITKSSHNIIDLIEVGDYVNGEYVTNVVSNRSYIGISREFIMIKEEDIKSIVTKEQFSQISYNLPKDK